MILKGKKGAVVELENGRTRRVCFYTIACECAVSK